MVLFLIITFLEIGGLLLKKEKLHSFTIEYKTDIQEINKNIKDSLLFNYIYDEEFLKHSVILLISGTLLFLADYFTLYNYLQWYTYILFISSYILSGGKTFILAFRSFIQGNVVDEKFLIIIATIGTALLGKYSESVFVMLFYEVGKIFEDYAMNKCKASLSSYIELKPSILSKKTNLEKYINRFTYYYKIAIVIMATLLALVPPLFLEDGSYKVWIYKGLIFLVICIPYGFVLCIPLTYLCGICCALQHEIIIKDVTTLESLNNAETIIFHNSEKFSNKFVSADVISEIKKTIIDLKSLNVKNTVLLYDNNKNIGEYIGKVLGFDLIYTDLSINKKIIILQELIKNTSSQGKVVFIGDSISYNNLSFNCDINISINNLNYKNMTYNNDIVIKHNSPYKISDTLKIAKFTSLIARENIIFTVIVKTLLLAFTTFGYVNMWEAIFADISISIIVILNSMRAMNIEL